MKPSHKMMMLVHPLEDLLVKALFLEVGIKDQPDSLIIRAILRQLSITNNRKQMRQLFRLSYNTLDYVIAQIVLERSIGKLRRVDDNIASAVIPGYFMGPFAKVGFDPGIA